MISLGVHASEEFGEHYGNWNRRLGYHVIKASISSSYIIYLHPSISLQLSRLLLSPNPSHLRR